MESENDQKLLRAYEVAVRKARDPRLTFKDIADELNWDREEVSKLWELALTNRIFVGQAVLPNIAAAPLNLTRVDFERAFRRFGLRHAILVPGDKRLVPEEPRKWKQYALGNLAGIRDAVYDAAVIAASGWLAETIVDGTVLALAWGRTVRQIVSVHRPKQPRPGLTVLPMLGMLSVRPDAIEANVLVQQMAAAYGTERRFWLPVPAIVRDQHHKAVVTQIPLVSQVLAELDHVNLVVAGVGAPGEKSTLVHRQLLEREELQQICDAGAVGEVCALWYDRAGRPVPTTIQPIGLTVEALRGVAERGKVLIVCAGDCTRLNALHAAIRGGLVTHLATDEASARALLNLESSGAE